MEFRIREATLADLPHLIHHRRAMFEDMGYNDSAALDAVDKSSQQYFHQALTDSTYKAWLAVNADDEVLAGGGVVLARWPGFPGESLSQRAWILNMYTEPHLRRCGFARQILQVILNWCRANGLAIVSLHASPAGRHLYEAFGFEPTNELRLKLR